MRKFGVLSAAVFVGVVLVFMATGIADERYEFSGVTRIKVDGVSGDITILPADSTTGVVELRADVRPPRSFRPEVEQDGKTLYIEERWGGGSSSGRVEWTIYLPRDEKPPKIKVSTASGELTCRGIAARIRFNTASGDIELSNVTLGEGSSFSTASGDVIVEDMAVEEGSEFSTASGDVILKNVTIGEDCEFSTASGDVKCRDCAGYFELSSASGDVVARDCEISGRGSFSSASGDVRLYLDKLPKHDLKATSASGNVLLDVDDFGDNFTLVMVKREDRGRISCPFDFTHEDVFEDYHTYEEKIVERGSGQPEIYLRTASGKVVVKD